MRKLNFHKRINVIGMGNLILDKSNLNTKCSNCKICLCDLDDVSTAQSIHGVCFVILSLNNVYEEMSDNIYCYLNLNNSVNMFDDNVCLITSATRPLIEVFCKQCNIR